MAFSSGVSHSPVDTNMQEDVYLFAPAGQTRLAFNRASYEVGEDGSRLATHVIRVLREGNAIDTAATVKLNTSDGTATAGSDYVPLSETLTFAPGETEKTLTVQIINDDVLEPAETFHLTLSGPTGNSTLGGQSSATLTIGDDDLHTVQFGTAQPFDHMAFEATSSGLITVTRTGATTQTVSVDYTSSDGTASAGARAAARLPRRHAGDRAGRADERRRLAWTTGSEQERLCRVVRRARRVRRRLRPGGDGQSLHLV